MAKEVAKALGVKPVFEAMAFSGILPALDSGRCDCTLAGPQVFGTNVEKDDAELAKQEGMPADGIAVEAPVGD